ncbi:MAG TPA: pitrilysin family protein [Gammaproteobacteria bacterium]
MKAHAAALVLSASLAACGDDPPPAPTQTEEASIVLLPVAEDPTVSFSVSFRVGSQNDPRGKAGLAYLTGQMLGDAATEANTYDAILEKLYPLAAWYGVRVDKEMTTLTGRTHRDNLDAYVPLLTDAYLRPAFRDDDFERIKNDTINYLMNTLRYASDEDLAKAALYERVFAGTGYAHPEEGTVAGLRAVTLDDVRAFYAEHYRRANALIALGGGFGTDLARRMQATLDDLAAGAPAAPPPLEVPPLAGRRVLLIDKPGADASISFGFPIDVHRGERDFYALWIANSWLGEHRNQSSHLFQVIREVRGLNYGDYSYIESFPDGGELSMPPVNVPRRRQIFEVWVRTLPNDQALFALRAAVRELERLVDGGLTREQFELTRTFLKKYSLHFADTTSMRLGYAVDDRFYGIEDEGHLERFRRMMDELTFDEVNAAIKKHLQYANLEIAIVTGDAAGLSAALATDAPSPITYASPQPQEILGEDVEIANFALGVPADQIETRPIAAVFEGP